MVLTGRRHLPLAPQARFTKAAKQCDAMRAKTPRRNGDLGATNLECFGKNHTNRESTSERAFLSCRRWASPTRLSSVWRCEPTRANENSALRATELERWGKYATQRESTSEHACLSRRRRAPPKRQSSVMRWEPTHEEETVPSEPPNMSLLLGCLQPAQTSRRRSSVNSRLGLLRPHGRVRILSTWPIELGALGARKKLVLMKAQRYECSTISLLTSALRM